VDWVGGVGAFAAVWRGADFHPAPEGGVKEGESYVKTTRLVDESLYAVVRHPQYLGGILVQPVVDAAGAALAGDPAGRPVCGLDLAGYSGCGSGRD